MSKVTLDNLIVGQIYKIEYKSCNGFKPYMTKLILNGENVVIDIKLDDVIIGDVMLFLGKRRFTFSGKLVGRALGGGTDNCVDLPGYIWLHKNTLVRYLIDKTDPITFELLS